jgi:hypothetical protein
VWELGVESHERRARTDYLLSGRDDAARTTYLRSTYDGIV